MYGARAYYYSRSVCIRVVLHAVSRYAMDSEPEPESISDPVWTPWPNTYGYPLLYWSLRDATAEPSGAQQGAPVSEHRSESERSSSMQLPPDSEPQVRAKQS